MSTACAGSSAVRDVMLAVHADIATKEGSSASRAATSARSAHRAANSASPTQVFGAGAVESHGIAEEIGKQDSERRVLAA
jgi:hypothetical protein